MTNRKPDVRPVRTTAAGEILITHNHIALLQGLYACPRGTAFSHAEWIRSSLPYVLVFRQSSSAGCLRFAARRLDHRWVTKIRRGRRIEVSLTERGRAIVENRIPVRVRGWGIYSGIKPTKPALVSVVNASPTDLSSTLSVEPASPGISPCSIREAEAYAKAYGIPLLSHVSSASDLTIFAVTTQLDGEFILKCREEVERRGPRRWHARWAQIQLDRGYLPAGYRRAFDGYDEEDILCYLRELRAANRDKSAYCRAYARRDFLSEAKLQEWLDEEIDFVQSDIDDSDIAVVIRALSDSRTRLSSFIGTPGVLSWKHPDTGETIGRVINPNTNGNESFEIGATGCVALSCLQLALDAAAIGIRIETRYFPDWSVQAAEVERKRA